MNHINRFLNFLISLDEPHFANSASAMEMDAANESWVMLAPYGDWPNVQGLQRFKKEDADNIVNEFSSLASLPQRVLGLPWYVGHPDHPSFKDTYKDGSAKGRIKKLEARADGLWANVKWNADGKKLITDEAFHGHSVNWRMKQKGGAWSPFSLKSVGFTNEPQIPVPTILSANEAASEGKEEDVVMLPEFANGSREGVIKSWETRNRGGTAGVKAPKKSRHGVPENPEEHAAFEAARVKHGIGDHVDDNTAAKMINDANSKSAKEQKDKEDERGVFKGEGRPRTGPATNKSASEKAAKLSAVSNKKNNIDAHLDAADAHHAAAWLHSESGDTEKAKEHGAAAKFHSKAVDVLDRQIEKRPKTHSRLAAARARNRAKSKKEFGEGFQKEQAERMTQEEDEAARAAAEARHSRGK